MFWQPKDFSPISYYFLFAPLILWFFFPYIQSEVQTRMNYTEFSQVRFCYADQNVDFKMLRIIYLEKQKGNAKIYCLYQDTNKNYSSSLYYVDQNWFVEQTRPLKEGFYWPIFY